MTTSDVTWLTQEAYDRLREEHDHLVTEGRTTIAKEIDERRQEGDLKENGGYHAAREEQAKMEARIQRLKHLLETAVVGEAPEENGVAAPGSVVTAEVAGREMRFLIGSREAAGDAEIDVFSGQSPLGEAVIGKAAGGEASYVAPNGKEISVKVISVEAFSG